MEKTMKIDRFAPLTQDEMFAVEGGYYPPVVEEKDPFDFGDFPDWLDILTCW
jgi:hypothetical protein